MAIRNDIIFDICRWNDERDNLEYDTATEFTMLSEEIQELLMAKQKVMLKYASDNELDPYEEATFTKMSEDDKNTMYKNIRVEEADALADTIFVAVGGLYKLTGGSLVKTGKILSAVLEANEKKGKDKENGKITKPKDFVGPETYIMEILND